jgi:hypothetical protein
VEFVERQDTAEHGAPLLSVVTCGTRMHTLGCNPVERGDFLYAPGMAALANF